MATFQNTSSIIPPGKKEMQKNLIRFVYVAVIDEGWSVFGVKVWRMNLFGSKFTPMHTLSQRAWSIGAACRTAPIRQRASGFARKEGRRASVPFRDQLSLSRAERRDSDQWEVGNMAEWVDGAKGVGWNVAGWWWDGVWGWVRREKERGGLEVERRRGGERGEMRFRRMLPLVDLRWCGHRLSPWRLPFVCMCVGYSLVCVCLCPQTHTCVCVCTRALT